MSNEIEGKLIAEILSAKTQQKIVDLLDEIGKINSPSFCYPLYEVYKKVKNKAYSHFIIAVLRRIDSEEVINIALEIGNAEDTPVTDLGYVVEIFKDRKYFNSDAVKISLNYFNKLQNHDYCLTGDLHNICTYLTEAGQVKEVELKISSFFQNNNFEQETRIYALNLYITFNPSNRIQELIDKYDNIKNDEELDVIVAKVLNKWKGPKVDELNTKIKKTGGIRAKYIIETEEKKKKKELEKTEIEKEETIKKIYNNAEIIANIIKSREEINSIARRKSVIGFDLFPQNESIFKQLTAAADEPTFVNACNELRPFISNISEELKKVDIGFTDEQMQKLLPSTNPADYNKPLNKLFLFLVSKKCKISNDILGLRPLNRIISLTMHPEEKDELVKELEKIKLNELYNTQDYGILHQSLLEKYLLFLQNFTILINSISD